MVGEAYEAVVACVQDEGIGEAFGGVRNPNEGMAACIP